MHIDQEFEVNRPAGQVWDFFQDVEEVAKCLPGATLTGVEDDGRYAGSVQVKLGPMELTFEGKAGVEVDETGRTGVIQGSGADRRGGSRGKVKVDYQVHEANAGTRVTLGADLTLSGQAAQFGRVGLIKEMSGRIIEEFVSCLEAKLAAESVEEAAGVEAEAIEGGSLVVGSLWAMIVRFFRRLFGRS